MHFLSIFLLFLISIYTCGECSNATDQCPNVKTSLGAIRKRRHLTFPAGSNFIMTLSLLKAFMTHAPSGWNLSLEVDVLFPLPEANFTNVHFRRKLHHRQKREYWERIQNAIDFHNLNGRDCVLRSICEARSSLAPPGKSLVHDILRVIFTAPIHEEDFTNEVADSYYEVLEPNFCDKINDCPFSLMHFMLAFNNAKRSI